MKTFYFNYLLMSAVLLGYMSCGFAEDEKAEDKQPYFAVVNNEVISAEKYFEEFRVGVRETFYHGKVTEKQIEDFRETISKKLVDRTLLAQEAKKRGLTPDAEQVKKEIEKETAKYRQQKNWESSKDAIISSIRKKIEFQNLIDVLEQKTRNIKEPSEKEVLQYYKDHPDKFTAPEKWNVSIILLKVDPSSTSDVWKNTSELADDIVYKLREGENFEELARIHSGDESAVNGGNMGYIHIGMLSKPAQNVLNSMEIGQISEPVMLLQGVAIFRLNGVQGDRLNKFSKVKARAKDLLIREKADQAWKKLIITLRDNGNIKINEDVVKQANTGPQPRG